MLEIFINIFFDFELGNDEGGSKTTILPFALNINLSITSSKHELSKKLAKRYSSFLVETGSLRSLSLSYEPRTM
jgi:hypothetical protein